MRRFSFRATGFLRIAMMLAVFMAFSIIHASADGMKLEAVLVWGTNDDKPADKDVKPVEPQVERKLKKLPFKWKNYFEVNRKDFVVSKNGSDAVVMSKDCEIRVRNPSGDTLEVTLLGKGKEVSKITQSVPKGELLVMGGNAENLTSWFVVIRQVE
jgi:hypothetical protein